LTWLVKVKHNGGGESVISSHVEKVVAEAKAAHINAEYQADNYYVEECDAAKSEWPSTLNRAKAFLAKREQLREDA